MDVAGKLIVAFAVGLVPVGFNPSSNGCGWKTLFSSLHLFYVFSVSILLLMDVAGKLSCTNAHGFVYNCFNPSSNGCGWKTQRFFKADLETTLFQSFF